MDHDTHRASIVRLFTCQPDRLAAAWRRLRWAQAMRGEVPENLLDGVIEPFVRELGYTLAGTLGSAWSRCGGVLRLSPDRGVRGLYEEFAALRRCALDAVETLGGGYQERHLVNSSIDEAADSAVAELEARLDPAAERPRPPFGGIVLEFFEHPSAPRGRPAGAQRTTVH